MIDTPKDQSFKMKINGATAEGSLRFRLNWGADKEAQFKKAQTFIDSEVLRRCAPLVPYMNGGIRDSGTISTVIGSGEVQYNAPHAKYHYYGKVMVGKAPKKLTDRNLQHHGAPQKGAFWFERMKKTEKDDILRGAGEIVGK